MLKLVDKIFFGNFKLSFKPMVILTNTVLLAPSDCFYILIHAEIGIVRSKHSLILFLLSCTLYISLSSSVTFISAS